jgi:pantothenate kinase type III
MDPIENTIKETSWPDSKLNRNENKYISVSIGNTSVHWALHFVRESSIEPHLFWRTPLIIEEDVEEQDDDAICLTLARYLPEEARQFLFAGEIEKGSVALALMEREKRGYDVSIYIVSTNTVQNAYFGRLFKPIPSRIFLMKESDFFSEQECGDTYEGIGIDRLAVLRGAIIKYGTPTLVIDAGSVLSYIAADVHGAVVGGGMTPGLQMRLDFFSEKMKDLPPFDIAKITRDVSEESRMNGKSHAVEIFSTNMKHQVINGMKNEVVSGIRSVIQAWLDKIVKGKQKRKAKTPFAQNVTNHVIFTGGSGEMLEKMVRPTTDAKFRTRFVAGLLHFGVNYVLSKPFAEEAPMDDADISATPTKKLKVAMDPNRFVDERVAGYFSTISDDLFRGTVKSFITDDDGEYLYNILYDDGDTEDVYFEQEDAEDGRDLKSKFQNSFVVQRKRVFFLFLCVTYICLLLLKECWKIMPNSTKKKILNGTLMHMSENALQRYSKMNKQGNRQFSLVLSSRMMPRTSFGMLYMMIMIMMTMTRTICSLV